jgi:hypothetical protein
MLKKCQFILAAIFLIFNLSVIGRDPLDPVNSNYVVIGAFSIQANATHFVEHARRLNFKAEFAMNPARKLYYVYVLRTINATEAIAEARKVRVETPFNDTWVFTGLLGEDGDQEKGTDVNPITEQSVPEVEAIDQPAEDHIEQSKPVELVIPKVEEAALEGKGFIFKITTTSGEDLKGDVDVIDADRLVKTATYESNKLVHIKPVNKTGKITLTCEVFGYRKVQKEMNFNLPESTAGVVLENGNAIVPFEMIRLFKGDIAVMYSVLFFNDAAIMRPESRYEVNSLMEMMKENPKYKIKLHGHTNGNGAGKIIRIGDTKNFFSLTGGKEGFGSSKELSESRAEAIRDFLISEGIDANRLSIKAWGGKKALHDKTSSRAQENVRVEVEILED